MKKVIIGAMLMVPFVVLPLVAQEMLGASNQAAFSECAAVELYTHSPKHANAGKEIDKTTAIPEGWSLIGGSGGGGHPTMVICR